MIKTLSKAQKMEREKFRIPRSVQDAIPIRRIFADGIFQVGNRYSKTWSFTDINYAIAGKEDKTSMFLDYSELLNALDSGASEKITIYNRRINKAKFERSVLLPDKDDGLDEYRHEFNRMLTAQVTGTSNSIVRERYELLFSLPDHGETTFIQLTLDDKTAYGQLDPGQTMTLYIRGTSLKWDTVDAIPEDGPLLVDGMTLPIQETQPTEESTEESIEQPTPESSAEPTPTPEPIETPTETTPTPQSTETTSTPMATPTPQPTETTATPTPAASEKPEGTHQPEQKTPET